MEDALVIDELEKKRTKAIRSASRSSSMLKDALHALENGRTEVVHEFIERVTESLDALVEELR